jgi:hypothetical protein
MVHQYVERFNRFGTDDSFQGLPRGLLVATAPWAGRSSLSMRALVSMPRSPTKATRLSADFRVAGSAQPPIVVVGV